ncbi:unnamed protein product [Somion occarium]|uniref:Uncharacterized protein n=1 Tax=Somion occarium TaxID=3059160 RepID=A0ABP1D8M9_9APHY
MSNTQFVAVSDDDPSIRYEGNWAQLRAGGGSAHATFCSASSTSYSFTFSGTRITVGGVLLPPNGTATLTSTYTVDDSQPVTYRAPTNTTQESDSVVFFLSPFLSAAQHTLVVDVASCSTENPYIIQLIGYIPTSTSTLPSASYMPTNFPLPTGSAANGASTNESHSSTPVGAIVGGVIGGVALLVITAITLWYFCFRRGRGQPYFYKSAEAGDLLGQEVKPYDGPGPQSPPSTAPSQDPLSYYTPTVTGSHSPPASDMGGSSYIQSASNYTRQSYAPSTVLSIANPNAGPAVRASPNQPPSKAAQAGLLSIPQEATYHADSGVRFGAPGEPSSSGAYVDPTVPADIPPTYSER